MNELVFLGIMFSAIDIVLSVSGIIVGSMPLVVMGLGSGLVALALVLLGVRK